MSDVVPDGSGKYLKVKFIQRKDQELLDSAYLMDEVRLVRVRVRVGLGLGLAARLGLPRGRGANPIPNPHP